MVTQITGYKSDTGKIFTTREEATMDEIRDAAASPRSSRFSIPTPPQTPPEPKMDRRTLLKSAAAITAAASIPAATASATPEKPPKHDRRVFFMCEVCEDECPEGAVSHREDIAVMPDGTWLCSGCYSDCEKTAYGLIANPVEDFEFPNFEDLPRPPIVAVG